MNEILLHGQINSVRNITVEPRLIYAPCGAYMGRPKIVYRLIKLVCSRREDSVWWGKVLLWSVHFDCNRVPTYHTGSSEDPAEYRNGPMRPRGCIGL